MAEIFTPTDIAPAQEHFAKFGHVVIRGLYDPSIAPGAIQELQGEAGLRYARRPWSFGDEEQSAVAMLRQEADQPQLHALLRGVNAGAQMLGRSVMPSVRSDRLTLQVIRMSPGAPGRLHQDKDGLFDTVAITTIAGRSKLRVHPYADVSRHEEYLLEPGTAAFLDHTRKLPHQGLADGPNPRTGLVLFTERPPLPTF